MAPDQTARNLQRVGCQGFCDLHQRNTYRRAADLGCGLGYLTQRFNTEALVSPPCEIFGFVLTYGSSLLSKKFPDIQFDTLDLTSIPPVSSNKFDLVIIGNCIWYLLDELEAFLECADLMCSVTSTSSIVFLQASYHGDHLFPTPKRFLTGSKRVNWKRLPMHRERWQL